MITLIIVFGALVFVAGIVILVNPELIFGYLREHMDRLAVHILAVAVRLILGILLITQSDHSKFPVVIEVLGWLSVVAAVVLAIIGRNGFLKLMMWAFESLKRYGRVGGMFASAFGAFLIYSFL